MLEASYKMDFNEKKGFICDMDGVIYHGNRILPGVAEFIQWLHEEEKEYLFLTNNSGYTPRELRQKLGRMGLDVPEMTQLAGILRGAGVNLPADIMTCDEMAVELCRLK